MTTFIHSRPLINDGQVPGSAADDEERIILSLQYVTNQEMGPFKKMFPNLKDAGVYFGPAALLPWNPSKEKR